MKIVWYGLFNYIFPSLNRNLEKKADYISILLKIEKGFPKINLINLHHEM